MAEKEILLRLTIDSNQANKQLAENNELLRLNKEERIALDKQFKSGRISAEGYQRQINNLNIENKRLQTSNAALTKSAVAQKGSIAALRGEYSVLRERLNNAVVGLDITQKEFDDLSKKAFQAQVAIRNFDRSISGANQLVGEYDRGLKKANGTMNLFKQGLGAIGVTLGAGALISGLKNTITLFQTQEKAERQLSTALGFTSKALLDQASALQKVTTFGDEATLQAQALLAGFGLNESQLLRLTPALQDYAALIGADITTAANKLNNVLNGTSTSLRGTSVHLSVTASKAERFNEVMKALTEEGIKGQAQALAQTEGGRLEQLQNNFGDLAEKIGEKVLPLVNDFLEAILKLVEFVSNASDAYDEFLEQNEWLATTMDVLKTSVMAVTSPIGTLIGYLWDTEEAAEAEAAAIAKAAEDQRKMNEAIAQANALMEKYPDQIKEVGESFKNLFQGEGSIIDRFKDLGSTIIQAGREMIEIDKKLEEQEKRRQEALKSRDKEVNFLKQLREANQLAQKEGLERIEFQKNLELEEAKNSIKNRDLLQKTLNEINIKYGLQTESFIKQQKEKEAQDDQKSRDDAQKRAEEAAKKSIESARAEAEAKKAIKEQENRNTLILGKAAINLGVQLAGENKEAQKPFKIAEALINTYTGAAAAIAPPPLGLGPVAGIPLAAITIASGLANVAKIAQFQDGGILEGPSHANGGIPVRLRNGGMVEAEGGEGMINKRAMSSGVKLSVSGTPRQIASRINQVGGGKKFQDGGILSSSIKAPIDAANDQSRALMTTIMNMPKPVVSITEIRRANNKVQITENTGRF